MSIIVNSRISFVFALAFGKQVAKTIARDIRRQLPPLSPRSHELRGDPIEAALPHLESKTKLIMTASVNKYIIPKKMRFGRLILNYEL